MRTDTIFKVSNIDFSSHVLAGTYDVSDVPVYTEWTDANGREHHEVYRMRLQGSFDMYFKTMEEFEQFRLAIKAARPSRGYSDLTFVDLMNNSTNNFVTKQVYLEFSPTRNRHDNWEDYYEQFTVNVKEW